MFKLVRQGSKIGDDVLEPCPLLALKFHTGKSKITNRIKYDLSFCRIQARKVSVRLDVAITLKNRFVLSQRGPVGRQFFETVLVGLPEAFGVGDSIEMRNGGPHLP